MRIVLLTSDAPYLGGSATWAPLIAQNPQWSYEPVDLLACGEASDLRGAMIRDISAAVEHADAIVAHGAAAGPAVEATAAAKPALPIVLLAPRMVSKDRWIFKALRAAFRLGSPLLRSVARAKRRKLLTDTRYIEKQLRLLMAADAISPAIIEEARVGLADPRLDPFIERTAEVVEQILTPLEERVLATAANRTTFGERGAPMLERPAETAAVLRRILGNGAP